jgi:hypothetical protein
MTASSCRVVGSSSPRAWVVSIVCLVLFALSIPGCPDANRRAGDCPAGLQFGDVVITEIMANPKGPDSGNEWWEIYNATSEPIDMAGTRLVSSREDGASPKTHLVESLVIEPGGYAVVGNMLPEFVLPFVDYGYGNSLGDLRNAAGRVAVACGNQIIDEVVYLDMKDGFAQGFDGTREPDAVANDDLSSWCEATVEFQPGDHGSPGESNEPCGSGTPTSCLEDGVSREVDPVVFGDVVITEIMANSGVAPDAVGEWFEVYLTRDVDLNGLQIGERGTVRRTLSSASCMRYEAGTYLLFARSDDPAENGGLPPVDFTFSFNLVNSTGEVLLARDDEVLDAVAYPSSGNGVADNLDPRYFDPQANDERGVWCRATTPFGDGDLGTPGAPNIECEVAPPEGHCDDGGELRPTVAPQPGDLVITEVMANVGAVPDTDGEWFEIYARADVDLNGLQIYDRGDLKTTVTRASCLRATAGSHVLVARKEDPAVNGGLPPVDLLFTFNLVNSNGALAIGHGGEVLDEVTWASTQAGVSASVDPGAYDPESNDDPQMWCAGITPYGAGDLGTPGEVNPYCALPGSCIDGDTGMPREIVKATDVRITEVMTRPYGETDANARWFELQFDAAADLNGLEVGRSGTTFSTILSAPNCVPIPAGGHAIVARSSNLALNGLPRVDAVFTFTLPISPSDQLYAAIDGVELDSVAYPNTPASDQGTSQQRGEDGAFCTSVFAGAGAYDAAGNVGTPGESNLPCPGGDTCIDPVTMMARSIVKPTDLRITEVMTRPLGETDAAKRWLEVQFVTAGDLNGVEVGRQGTNNSTTIVSGACIPFAAGEHAILARSSNLGLTGLPHVDGVFDFTLTINPSEPIYVAVDGVELDAVSYPNTPIASAGTSQQRDGTDTFCTSQAAGAGSYNVEGDIGTPGSASLTCP